MQYKVISASAVVPVVVDILKGQMPSWLKIWKCIPGAQELLAGSGQTYGSVFTCRTLSCLRCQCYLCCPGLNADLGTEPLQTEQLSQLLCGAPGGRRSREELAQESKSFQPCLSEWTVSPLHCVNLPGPQQLLSALPECCWRRAQGRAGCSPTPMEGGQTAGAGNLGGDLGLLFFKICPSWYLLILPRLGQPRKPRESTQKGLVWGGKVIVIMLEEAKLLGQPRDADMQPSDKGEDSGYLAGRFKNKKLVSVTG